MSQALQQWKRYAKGSDNDDQVVYTGDKENLEYITRKLKEEYKP